MSYDQNDLHDSSVMQWGRFAGEKLGKIPDWYWKWFLDQYWCDRHPDLVKYANLVVDDDKD